MMNWFKKSDKKEDGPAPKQGQPAIVTTPTKSNPTLPNLNSVDSTKLKPESQKNPMTNVIMSNANTQQKKADLFAGMKKKNPKKEEETSSQNILRNTIEILSSEQKRKEEEFNQQQTNISTNSASFEEQTQPPQRSGFNFIKKEKKYEQGTEPSQLKEQNPKGLQNLEEESSMVPDKFLSELQRQEQHEEISHPEGVPGVSFSNELENDSEIEEQNVIMKQEIEQQSYLLTPQNEEHREYADISNANHEEHENTISSICNEITKGENKQQYGNSTEEFSNVHPVEIKPEPTSEKKLKLFEKFKKNAPAQSESNQQIEVAQTAAKTEEDESILMNSDRLFESIEREFNKLKQNMNQIVVQQHSLNTKKNYLEIDIEKLRKKIDSIERQQNEAVEKDNFDEAERLEALLNEQRELISKTEKERTLCMKTHADLEISKESIFDKEMELYQLYLNRIAVSSDKKRELRNEFEARELLKIRQEKNQIEEEKERLKINKNHMDLDIKHLEEEKLQIEDSMEKQTKEFKSEQLVLQEKQQELDQTIAKIKKELEQKQKEYEGIVSQLTSTTNKINQIRSKFDNQLTRLDVKKKKLDTEIDTFQREEENLNQSIQGSIKHENDFQERIREFDCSLTGFAEVKNQLSQKKSELEARRETRSSVFRLFSANNGALNQFEEQSKKDENILEKQKRDLLDVEKSIGELNSKKIAAEQKLPILENEKKNMIQQKKYKNAGQISSDIKDTQTQIDEYVANIEKLRLRERDINDSIAEIEYRKNNSGSIYNALLEKAEISKYHWLEIKEEDIKTLYEYALNEKHYEDCNILENELKNCKNELMQLKAKYKEKLEPQQGILKETAAIKDDNSLEKASENENNAGGDEKAEEPETLQQEASEQLDLETLINRANGLKEEIPNLEANINSLAENNDFDAADELQKVVEQKQKQLDELLDVLKANYGVEL